MLRLSVWLEKSLFTWENVDEANNAAFTKNYTKFTNIILEFTKNYLSFLDLKYLA